MYNWMYKKEDKSLLIKQLNEETNRGSNNNTSNDSYIISDSVVCSHSDYVKWYFFVTEANAGEDKRSIIYSTYRRSGLNFHSHEVIKLRKFPTTEA